MASPKKKKKGSEPAVPENAAAPPFAPRHRSYPRFRQVRFADGSERAVRTRSRSKEDSEQAIRDFFGAPSDLPLSSNQRSMEAILGEVLSRLNISVQEIAPDLLKAAWEEAVGPSISAHAQLVSISRGVALVSSLHPAMPF